MDALNPLTANSVISIGLMIVIVGATWKISSMFTTLNLKLDKLEGLPARVRKIEDYLLTQQEDLNNLFALVRAGPDSAKLFDQMRRTTFRPGED